MDWLKGFCTGKQLPRLTHTGAAAVVVLFVALNQQYHWFAPAVESAFGPVLTLVLLGELTVKANLTDAKMDENTAITREVQKAV